MFAKQIVIALVLVLMTACKTGVPESEMAAKVNGEAITKAEFQSQVDRNMERYRGTNHELPPSIETRIRESVLRRMIDDKMIELKAKELGAGVTKEELDEKFQEYKGRFRTDQAFQDYLKRSKNTEANMRDDLERNMLRDRVVEKLSGAIDVTDEEVAKYFDENKQRFVEREQVKASRILLRTPPTMPEAEKNAAKKRAKELRAKAVGGSDFAELAKESSNGPEASRGGDLGWFARGRMPPEFDNVVFNMEANSVSDVVETKMGLEIIKLWDKKAEHQRPIEEVKENIKNSLLARKRNEKRRSILQDLKAGAKIDTLITFEQTKPDRDPKVAGPGKPDMPGMPGMQPPGAPRLPTKMDLKPGMPRQLDAAKPIAPQMEPATDEGAIAPDGDLEPPAN